MGDSLFQRKLEVKPVPTTPHELIEKEVAHLKKGSSVRYGKKPRRDAAIWLLVLVGGGLLWLYLMDPIEHAWYKYEAIHAYGYLHSSGTGKEATELATSGIFRPDEIVDLNRSLKTYTDDYATPKAAAQTARTIINYMASVKALHANHYESLDLLGRLRYALFIRTGLGPYLPTAWGFLDPDVPSEATPAPAPPPEP